MVTTKTKKISGAAILVVGGALVLLADNAKASSSSSSSPGADRWAQVTTGPYGPHPGFRLGMAKIIFPHLNSHAWIQSNTLHGDDRMIPLNVIRDLFSTHPHISWRPSYITGVTKSLHLYKYGYVFKNERQLVEHIMSMAIINNTDHWYTIFPKNFSYHNYAISYTEEDLASYFPHNSMYSQGA
jgi:hypothetical protein